MITPQRVRDLQTATPFKPFLITMSDGRQFPVAHPEIAIVNRNEVIVGVDFDRQGFPRREVRCAILHITSVEDLKAEAAKS